MSLQQENGLGGHVGQHECVGVLLIGEGPRTVAIQIERPETDFSHPQREGEHGLGARLERRAAEGEPSWSTGLGQVRLQHGPILLVGIEARPLMERVLQFFNESAHLVGGTHRALRQVTGQQHDAGAAHGRDLSADLAQSLDLQLGSSGREQAEETQTPFAIRHLRWHRRRNVARARRAKTQR